MQQRLLIVNDWERFMCPWVMMGKFFKAIMFRLYNLSSSKEDDQFTFFARFAFWQIFSCTESEKKKEVK